MNRDATAIAVANKVRRESMSASRWVTGPHSRERCDSSFQFQLPCSNVNHLDVNGASGEQLLQPITSALLHVLVTDLSISAH